MKYKNIFLLSALVILSVFAQAQNKFQVYGQSMQDGKGGIPRIVYGSRWVVPQPNNADDLIMILQKSLGVPES